ncbi:MAG: hypothetical protein ABIO49_00455 [Dokdonella sp.]
MSTIDTGHRGDFLANVIDRAQARAAVVVPRPMSLFEESATQMQVDPVATEDSHPSRSASTQDADADARDSITLRAPSPDALRRPPPARPDGAALPVAGPLEPIHEAAVAGPVRPARRTAMSGEREDESVRVDTPIVPSLFVQQVPMHAPARASNPSVPTESSVLPTSAAVDAQRAEENRYAAKPNPRARLFDKPDTDFESPHVNARNEDAARSASLLPNHVVAATFREHAGNGGEPRREQMQQPAAAATVTISIGRVEVRATPAAATPSNTGAGTVLKPTRLDEYLERKERKR